LIFFYFLLEPSRDFAENAEQNVSVVAGEDFLDYGEKLVKPGELLYLPTVKTMSKSVETHSYIVARVCLIDLELNCSFI
jgi:uncharacterized RmlC-like cupin family protein